MISASVVFQNSVAHVVFFEDTTPHLTIINNTTLEVAFEVLQRSAKQTHSSRIVLNPEGRGEFFLESDDDLLGDTNVSHYLKFGSGFGRL